ncbi:MAG: homoserine kinase [Candidatus Heimdallarchaeota archaeon]|nr:homoserine kinase [Candidatus Heimdallarchaeota archaeon]
MSTKHTFFAPGSVANLGSGFDILGMAITKLGDKLEIECTEDVSSMVVINSIQPENLLPSDPTKNTAGIAAIETLNRVTNITGLNYRIELNMSKNMPISSGLGSSGASAAVSAYAVNQLTGNLLNTTELIQISMHAESIVSGYHADNVAASMLGGVVVIQQYHPLRIHKITPNISLNLAIIKPEFGLDTKKARSVIPELIPLKDHIHNSGNLASLIHALHTGDLDLLGKSMNDNIIEPRRKDLIKGYSKIKSNILDQGALSCNISGAGPSIVVLGRDAKESKTYGTIVQELWAEIDIDASLYLVENDTIGARKIENNS